MPDMTKINRVHAGVPTGGQFAAHERTESSVRLAIFEAAAARWEGSDRETAADSLRRMAALIFDAHPGAVTARMSFSERGSLVISDILDGDGRSLGPIAAELTARALPGDGTLDHNVFGFTWMTGPAGRFRRSSQIIGADIDIRRVLAPPRA